MQMLEATGRVPGAREPHPAFLLIVHPIALPRFYEDCAAPLHRIEKARPNNESFFTFAPTDNVANRWHEFPVVGVEIMKWSRIICTTGIWDKYARHKLACH